MSDYECIIRHYEECFRSHGDTFRGVDWPNLHDLHTRYRVMLEVIREHSEQVSLLDFGCGTAMLKDFLDAMRRNNTIEYAGLDASPLFIAHCRAKYPETAFHLTDVSKTPHGLSEFDYIIMNGVFTEKRELSFNKMLDHMKSILRTVFAKARKGIAFNVMSKAVDWEREDLFHVPADLLIDFLTKELSRHFVIRNDYGLYEFTTYVYRQPA